MYNKVALHTTLYYYVLHSTTPYCKVLFRTTKYYGVLFPFLAAIFSNFSKQPFILLSQQPFSAGHYLDVVTGWSLVVNYLASC